MSNRPEFAIGTAHALSGGKIRLVSILRLPALRPDPHFAHRAYAGGDADLDLPRATVFTGIERSEIMAVPFFILAGNFLTHGGVVRRMIDFATPSSGTGMAGWRWLGSPTAEPAQPRALIGGHLISTLVGLFVVKLCGPGPWVAAMAVGLAIAAMHMTDTFHPPAGIDP